jgi:hypothetical protein
MQPIFFKFHLFFPCHVLKNRDPTLPGRVALENASKKLKNCLLLLLKYYLVLTNGLHHPTDNSKQKNFPVVGSPLEGRVRWSVHDNNHATAFSIVRGRAVVVQENHNADAEISGELSGALKKRLN